MTLKSCPAAIGLLLALVLAPAQAATMECPARSPQMDDIIGRVMARLRATGLERDTLVFFLSDNGGAGGATNNGPEAN